MPDLVELGSVIRTARRGQRLTQSDLARKSGVSRARIDALEANRERYGSLTCECCLAGGTSQWHVDHIRPRSSHPELALEPANLQVLCAECNLGKGIRYTTDWRYQGQS